MYCVVRFGMVRFLLIGLFVSYGLWFVSKILLFVVVVVVVFSRFNFLNDGLF